MPSTLEFIYADGVLRAQGIADFAFNNLLAPGAIGMGYPITGLLPPGPTGSPPTPAPSYADGLIDDVRVYNRLLTTTATTVGQTAGGEVWPFMRLLLPCPAMPIWTAKWTSMT